jgi:hypothetical protein
MAERARIRATLPRVVTDISKDEDDWFSKCGVSVRVEWDDRFAHSLGIVIQQDLSVRIGSNYFESILDMGSGATTQHAV